MDIRASGIVFTVYLAWLLTPLPLREVIRRSSTCQTNSGGPLNNDSNKHWLVRAKTIKILWLCFIAILLLTIASELFIHKHEYFGVDGSFGFSAWYGFITCVAMVVVAKLLGTFLKRGEDYYDD